MLNIKFVHLLAGWLVDVWLVCEDGEAIPAHQLILGNLPPVLWIRNYFFFGSGFVLALILDSVPDPEYRML